MWRGEEWDRNTREGSDQEAGAVCTVDPSGTTHHTETIVLLSLSGVSSLNTNTNWVKADAKLSAGARNMQRRVITEIGNDWSVAGNDWSARGNISNISHAF